MTVLVSIVMLLCQGYELDWSFLLHPRVSRCFPAHWIELGMKQADSDVMTDGPCMLTTHCRSNRIVMSVNTEMHTEVLRSTKKHYEALRSTKKH